MDINNDYANKLIDMVVDFETKLQDPAFLKKMEEEERIMESLDLRTMFDEQEEIFMNMIQTVNDNILEDEIKILEFSERKDKEEIIESVMGS